MSEQTPKETWIWDRKNGITDLEENCEELSASEIPGIKAIWTEQRNQLKESPQLSEFNAKLKREWAIETGIIENLYNIDIGVTQTLIENGLREELFSSNSPDKERKYVIQMLHDQEGALNGIFDFVKGGRPLTTSYIKELHQALLRSQKTTVAQNTQRHFIEIQLLKGQWKKQPNFPLKDGVTYCYCLPEHVGTEMDRLIEMHNKHIEENMPSEIQAAWLHHRFTQIHPFQDGNGRVARAIASLVLIKDGLFPFVVKRDDKSRYLDSLEKADSGDDLRPLIKLITDSQKTQFMKASKITSEVLAEEDVNAALRGLEKTADKVADDRYKDLQKVIKRADTLESCVEIRLREIEDRIETVLQKVSATKQPTVFVTRSNSENNYYFRAQIITTAKNHLHYFVDTGEHRSWVALKMQWESRRSQLVFAFHGIGRPFNGSLICAPFMEFKDTDKEKDNEEEKEIRTTLIPVAQEGCVFFYNENEKKLLARFKDWQERAITVAIRELQNTL